VQLRLNRPGSVHWLHWDGEFVVFDEVSGRTHQLDAQTAHALMCIEDGVTGIDALADRWCANDPNCDARTALTFVLDQLLSANLIDSFSE